MRGAFYDYSHGIYGCLEGRDSTDFRYPQVKVAVEDGRSFIQRTDGRLDVIQRSQVATWASMGTRAYSLVENYLYTVNALEGHLSLLTETGITSISRWKFSKPRETLRLTAVALEVLRRFGVERPEDHLLVLLDGRNSIPIAKFGTVLISRSPFSTTLVVRGATRLLVPVVTIAYARGLETGKSIFPAMILAVDRNTFFAPQEYDVTPVFDERPFYFFMDSSICGVSRVTSLFADHGDLCLPVVQQSWQSIQSSL